MCNTITKYAVNIIDACMNYPDGLKHLFEAVRFFDGKTEPFQKLSEFFSRSQTEFGNACIDAKRRTVYK